MKWIDSTDIRNWANKRDCQDTLPSLIRKLIRATSNSIQSINFPSGENILLGGWDGILNATEETEYLPLGVSLWEFGTSSDAKGKADEDYKKRTTNPLGFNPAESTFIFVTPRLWTQGKKWAKERQNEKIWNDIKVIDSVVLEEWIEIAPTVGSWLAKHIGKYPEGGVQPTDDFWEEWSTGPKFRLNAEILLGGRKAEQEKVINILKQPSLISVQGISREESIAFIISCFKNNPDKDEDFFSRSIIVDNVDIFRKLSIHDKPLILIPRFEDNGVLNRAIQKGHTVIVPLGADSACNWGDNIIRLPEIERESFVSALEKSGMTSEIAERYSKESARNITILRRQLEFTRMLPTWALTENVAEIIPALIVGRWDEAFEKDKNIVSKVSGDTYENYSKKLIRWLYKDDSPIVKIGSTWRLASPFDAWTNASKKIVVNDFNLLYRATLEILTEINPAFQLPPEQRPMASIYGKKREFSAWIREGVIQSLILTSIFGDKLEFNLPLNAELWVDKIIAELLCSDNPEMWKSFEKELPLIAEASPTAFLDSVEKHITMSNSPITALFNEDPGLVSPQSYHTGLLWALENLAWFPQYLSRVSLILAKLSSVDPGGHLSNRPINSLFEIFNPLHYQTLASFDERMQVLKLISQKESETAWTILISMLPNVAGGFSLSNSKTRWRMFELITEKTIMLKEVFDTHLAAIEMLISLFDFSEFKLATLIERSVHLIPSHRDRILSFVESVLHKVIQVQFEAWHTTRETLSNHRSHPEARWALPEVELKRYEKLYEALEPNDEIDKTIWMFKDYWPSFPEGFKYKSGLYDIQKDLIRQRRVDGLNDIYKKYGIEKINELSETVKESAILGDILSDIINENDEITALCKLLINGKSDLRCIESFLYKKSLRNNPNWIFSLFERLKEAGFSNSALAKFLVPLNQTQQLWDFIESLDKDIIREYWENFNLQPYSIDIDEKVFGLKKLLEYKRFFSAIKICSYLVEEMPSDIIVEILLKGGTEKTEEKVHLDGYEISRIFQKINNRDNIDLQILIQLEWLFLPVLISYNNDPKPKRLHHELATNPHFFIDVLKWIYKPIDKTIVEVENDLTDEQIYTRARRADELLNSWEKIPGVDESGNIDYDFLNDWVTKVRELALNCGRITAADIRIGQVLAQYPEKQNKVWPPDEICKIIESINSVTINNDFLAATFNKRGSTTRGVFDGGNIERLNAAHFQELAELHKNKFPVITGIFEKLAKNYEEDAKRSDEEAERDRLEY